MQPKGHKLAHKAFKCATKTRLGEYCCACTKQNEYGQEYLQEIIEEDQLGVQSEESASCVVDQ